MGIQSVSCKLNDLEYIPPYCPTPFNSQNERWTKFWTNGFYACYPIAAAETLKNEKNEFEKGGCWKCLPVALAVRTQYCCCCAELSIPIDVISCLFNAIACATYTTSALVHGIVCSPCLFTKEGGSGFGKLELNYSKIALNYLALSCTTISSATFHTALLPFNILSPEICFWQYFIDLKIYEISSRSELNINESHSELKNGYQLLCPTCCDDSYKPSRESGEYHIFWGAGTRRISSRKRTAEVNVNGDEEQEEWMPSEGFGTYGSLNNRESQEYEVITKPFLVGSRSKSLTIPESK